LVGTPIGNLEDITLRAMKVLASADVLYCEDTRRTRILLDQCKVQRQGPVESFHDHSAPSALRMIGKLWDEGKHIAYATDGGMPGVSDPGYALVQLANKKGVAVSVVPGPTAVTAFFAVAGLPSPKFLFHGFFPKTRGEIDKVLQVVRDVSAVHVFYEAPQRVEETLAIFAREMPEAAACLGREMTKIYEEFVRGTAAEVSESIAAREERVRGECVIGIMGGNLEESRVKSAETEAHSPSPTVAPWEPDAAPAPVELTEAQRQEVLSALSAGQGSKEVAKSLCKKFGISRRELYDYIVRRLT
jgi:16S rRNA (cytidine1402-2'-O)-methyltransferase